MNELNPQQRQRLRNLTTKTLPSLPRRLFSTNEKNTACFASNLRGDTSGITKPGDVGRNKLISPELTDGDSDATGRKLKIRGLKNFVEKRGCGVPPNWVKEFPCRSRYHPDTYLYDFEESPFNPKRNVEAMNQCPCKGGRCTLCGVFSSNLCPACKQCESDCACPGRFRRSNAEENILNGFGGMSSLDSIVPTLHQAQKLLKTSQNAPTVYPFTNIEAGANRKQAQSQLAYSQQSSFPGYHPQAYPYPYPYPPFPYMMPPPPVYVYPYPPPPIGMGYPPPPMGHGSPYALPYQQSPQIQAFQSGNMTPQPPQPTCRSYVSINNADH